MKYLKKSVKETSPRPNKVTLAIGQSLIFLSILFFIHFFVRRSEMGLIHQFRHNAQLESELNSLLSNLQDAETGQKGFLLTSNKNYLEPYLSAVETNKDIYQKIVKEIGDDKKMLSKLHKLRQLTDDKFEELKATIDLSLYGHPSKAIDLVNTDFGKLKMDSIRTIIREMRLEELSALNKDEHKLNKMHQSSNIIVIISTAILIGLLIYIYAFVQPFFAKLKQRNIELVEKQKLIQSKNKELEHFAYITSHDLKEPSRTIAGFINAFEEDYGEKLDEEAHQYLGFIKDASQRMNTMIGSILSFSRLGETEPFAKVNLNETLELINKDLILVKNENDAIIERQNLPIITGKGSLIKLLFQNLISNAIKFRKENESPIINISFKEDPHSWAFFVHDNGIGITPKMQNKIFNFFTKLHLPSEYEGQGIGLAFCKKIVELHRGNISVESNSGEGATFKFTISKHLQNDN